MPLTEQEAAQAYEAVAAALRRAGLGWVVDQVTEKLALGKLRTKKLPRRRSADEADVFRIYAPAKTTSQRAEAFTISEVFTPHEHLEALVESTRLAVHGLSSVAIHTLESLGSFSADDALVRLDGTVTFAPEAPTRVAFTLSSEEILSRKDDTERLMSLLDELRDGGPHAFAPVPSR